MRTVLTAFIFFQAALLFSAVQIFKPLDADPFKAEGWKLDNGIRVVICTNRDTDNVYSALMIEAGSVDDPADKTGLAHYLEHLLFKGSRELGTVDYEKESPIIAEIEELYSKREKLTDEAERDDIYRKIDTLSQEAAQYAVPNEYSRLMANLGVTGVNAYTSYFHTAYIASVPSRNLERYFKCELDRFANPVFRGFHTELETVYEEQNMYADSKERGYYEFFNSNLFAGNPRGRNISGTPEDLRNPSPSRVMEFFKKNYVTGNMTLVLVGNTDSATIIPILESTLGQLPSAPAIETAFKLMEPVLESKEFTYYSKTRPDVTMAWRLPELSSREKDVAHMAAMIAASYPVGIIDRDFTAQMLLAEGNAGFGENRDGNHFFYLSATPSEGESTGNAKSQLDRVVDKMVQGDFPEWIIEAATNHRFMGILNMSGQNSAVAQFICAALNDGEDWHSVVNRLFNSETVSKEEIMAFSAKYLSAPHLTFYNEEGELRESGKFAKPPITPLVYREGIQSKLFNEIVSMPEMQIEIAIPDINRDLNLRKIEISPFRSIPLFSAENSRNELFHLYINVDSGSCDNPDLSIAAACFDFAGNGQMDGESLNLELYKLGGNASMNVSDYSTTITVFGLYRNFGAIMKLVDSRLNDASVSKANLSRNIHLIRTGRSEEKSSPDTILGAMKEKALLGERSPFLVRHANAELDALSTERIESLYKSLLQTDCQMFLFAPENETLEITSFLNFAPELRQTPKREFDAPKPAEKEVWFYENSVLRQTQMIFLKYGEKYTPDNFGVRYWFAMVYSAGMDSMMFRELREKQGLCYNVFGAYKTPDLPEQYGYFDLFLSTQNDKLTDALSAVRDIGFPISDEELYARRDMFSRTLRQQRFSPLELLDLAGYYYRMKLPGDYRKKSIEQLESATVEELREFYDRMVKDCDVLLIVGPRPAPGVLEGFGSVREIEFSDIIRE